MKRLAVVFAVLVGIFTIGALPLDRYKEAAANATYHVQLRIHDVRIPTKTPGECRVFGEVVRALRDKTGTMKPGAKIDFDVSCKRATDEIPVGATIWKTVEDLQRARYLDAFLNREKGAYSLALWQSEIIAHPSPEPAQPKKRP